MYNFPKYSVSIKKYQGDLNWYDVYESTFHRYAHSFWLDTNRIAYGARFSFMGACVTEDALVAKYDLESNTIYVNHKGKTQNINTDIFTYLDQLLNILKEEDAEYDVPFDFALGIVGYLGYELKYLSGGESRHASSYPDSYFMLPDRMLVIDHLNACYYTVTLYDTESNLVVTDTWFSFSTTENIDKHVSTLNLKAKVQMLTEDFNETEYYNTIKKVFNFLHQGESYEICITNRIKLKGNYLEPLKIYASLRDTNPAPYSCFLKFDDIHILSCSPERFLKIDRDKVISTKPIKGTARRHKDDYLDQLEVENLRNSEKNRAENLMIVDLLRNDLGKVCEVGSVKVSELMAIETYEGVHQMVSTITGNVKSQISSIECIKAAFPGGSMTGAPKVRTMTLIDQLEKSARGIYSGAIGYISADGCLDLNIVIRTMIIEDDLIEIGSGGAITILSDAEEEWEEIQLKIQKLFSVLDINRGKDAEYVK